MMSVTNFRLPLINSLPCVALLVLNVDNTEYWFLAALNVAVILALTVAALMPHCSVPFVGPLSVLYHHM